MLKYDQSKLRECQSLFNFTSNIFEDSNLSHIKHNANLSSSKYTSYYSKVLSKSNRKDTSEHKKQITNLLNTSGDTEVKDILRNLNRKTTDCQYNRPLHSKDNKDNINRKKLSSILDKEKLLTKKKSIIRPSSSLFKQFLKPQPKAVEPNKTNKSTSNKSF